MTTPTHLVYREHPPSYREHPLGYGGERWCDVFAVFATDVSNHPLVVDGDNRTMHIGCGLVVGYLVRERIRLPDGSEVFQVRGEFTDADEAGDVHIPIVHMTPGKHRISNEGGSPIIGYDYQCPDCGSGPLECAEAVGVPGSRQCAGCVSRFNDLRYGIAPPWLEDAR